jgi:hypothetical protein
MTAKFNFEPLGGSPEDGYNDPLKTIFGNSVEAVTREAFQNSIDAVKNSNEPVKIKVRLDDWKPDHIPEVEQLKQIFQACKEAAEREKNKSGIKHFENSISILEGTNIPVLVISDTNTTGLTGADTDTQGNFYKFFKSVGGHAKAEGSAGSYGFGKTTNIAFSAIDTFFASSVYYNEENESEEVVFMGSVRVCSYDINEIRMRGIGSFSKEGQLPIRDKKDIPQQFTRESSCGTSVYIPAYKNANNWKESTIKSALKNFWLAILNNKLQVEILEEGVAPVVIDSTTLESLLNYYYAKTSEGASWKKDSPLPYYLAYTKAKKQEARIGVLGEVECYLLAGKSESAPNYIACFRKNLMLIQHIRFKSIIPYSGVFVCTSEDGNKILQKMEPPQHDAWDPKVPHAKDDHGNTLTECVAADKEYKIFLKEKIHEMLGSRTSKKIALTSLDGRLTLENDENEKKYNSDGNAKEIAENNNEDQQVIRRTTRIQEASRINTRASNVFKDGKVVSNKTKKKKNTKKQTKKTDPNVVGDTVANLRAFTIRDSEGLVTKLIIRSSPNIKFKIQLKAGTEDSTANVRIKSSTLGTPCDIDGKMDGDKTCITGLTTDSNGEARFEVKFEENQKYSLSADFYEIR